MLGTYLLFTYIVGPHGILYKHCYQVKIFECPIKHICYTYDESSLGCISFHITT